MSCFSLLPESIYPILRDYLICYSDQNENEDIQSWNNFLNTNKSLFHIPPSYLKAKYVYFNLSPEYSDAYIYCSSTYSRSNVYQDIIKIRAMIRSPKNQIRLQLSSFDYCNFHQTFSFFFFRQSDSRFQYCHSLDISYQLRLTNLSSLEGKKVTALNCSGCERLTDLHPLKGVEDFTLSHSLVADITPLQDSLYVKLSNLPVLSDVSCLGRLHSVSLQCCPEISDVSMLGNLHKLIIDRCPKVTDISKLDKIFELSLIELFNIVHFLPSDNEVKSFTCSTFYLPQILTFKHKEKKQLYLLDFHGNLSLYDLKGWKNIGLCGPIFAENALNAKIMSPISLLRSFANQQLPPIRRLEIIGAKQLELIHHLSFLYYLNVTDCPKIEEIDFTSFSKLKQCWIVDCRMKLITVDGCLERLTISKHVGIVEVNLFSDRLKSLHIEYCRDGGKIQFLHEKHTEKVQSKILRLIGSNEFHID